MMKILKSIALSVLAIGLMGLATGASAPDFTAKNQDGKPVTLSQFKGSPVLIYFYPKDDTPGCTKQACDLRDNYSKFTKLGAVILGVSRQDEKSHQEFKKKHHLPFDLLVDQDGSLAEKLGVKTMFGIGLHQRQSILIGPDMKVIRFYPEVDPRTHADEILKELQAIKR